MSDIAIRVEGISKQYHIGKKREKYATLRDTLTDVLAAPFRRASKLLRGQATGAAELDETIWALKEVSFEVGRGEVVGIIGRNGAGKSTLLKILSRITEPTEGYAEIHGRVGSLLEVGTGFHPELTGRENIYLNGAILGMKRVEIDHKFDEIVAFSEVERFIDTPVKHYSSGMYLRLAFAVAAHLEPEILLIDEVLAVGDAAFQKKCIGKMGSVAKEGRTVVFVSHNMGAITQLCERTLWLDEGRLRLSGLSSDVVAAYLSSGTEGQATWYNPSAAPRDLEVQLKSARVLFGDNRPTATVDFDSPFRIELTYDVFEPIRDLSVAYQLIDSQGSLVFEAMDTDSPEWKGRVRQPGRYIATCRVPGYLLKPGRYHLSLVSFVERVKIIERQEGVLTFDVSEVGYCLNPGRLGVVSPVLEWEVSRVDGGEFREV
ncbi:MAG: ABC transporter ATP-binding protein [Anaerolineae bacterium]|jgi:lipopolysaccharide transport system ATP-binding protein|nr:ABC transporter ATP-binding protein [Anaerolineae bacterium]MDH7473668.1 ABC transporter ATP-binding protein [Anaerolineae bacterium]